ncbi:MAG: hypothetical protein NTV86_13715 [Planctomycetota bacterium]|nr:hypothetical protein [Planctomycetota bacterium]
MSRFIVELATPADEAELRRILAAGPTPGAISVAFLREPNYFGDPASAGEFRQVIVIRDNDNGSIAGMGCRSIRLCSVNGRWMPVGYLSNLRLLPPVRGQGLLARGYEFLRELHADGRTAFYLSTIAADNQAAIAALTVHRAGLPAYHFAGQYVTTVLPLGRSQRQPASGVQIRPAGPDDMPDVLRVLTASGPGRQFFPCYQASDFGPDARTFLNLRSEDIFLAFRRQQLVGLLAAWDQYAFRQNVVHSYHGPLRALRPLYNAWAGLTGRPRLPQPGQPLRSLVAALPVVADDDPRTAAALLDAAMDARRGQGWDYLLVGLHESDPLLRALHARRGRRYVTNLYVVCWPDGESLHRWLDARPPYLELGTL